MSTDWRGAVAITVMVAVVSAVVWFFLVHNNKYNPCPDGYNYNRSTQECLEIR